MSDADKRRAEAVRGIQTKRRFRQSLVVYLAVNSLLVVIWAANRGGSFWPIWPILGWGLAVFLQARRVYGQQPITEGDIQGVMSGGET